MIVPAAQPTHATEAQLRDFLGQLRRLVRDEAEATRRQIAQIWALPLGERVANGHAIAGVRIVARGAGWLDLACDRNESRFRVGDQLCLHRGDPQAAPCFSVALAQDAETQLHVTSADPALQVSQALHTSSGWVLDAALHDLSHLLLDALDQAGATAAGRERVLPLLLGLTRPTSDGARYLRGLAIGAAAGLNDQQQEALAQAYAANQAYLIQGPPGTGKTRVLAHLAAALAQDGARVLVTALTHRAINHALNTLARVEPDALAFKIGAATHADDLRVACYESFAGSPLLDHGDGYIIGATPFATRSKRLAGVEFDTVIVDEAGQMTLPLALMAMLVGTSFIFIGDQQQLPPVLISRDAAQPRWSVFGALIDRGFDTMLTATYRMNAALTAWPSAQFYAGRLTPANAAVAARRLTLTTPPAQLAEVLDPKEPLVFLDVPHRNTTTRSQREASAVTDLVLALLASGVPAGEIGVIAPYKRILVLTHNRPLMLDLKARYQRLTHQAGQARAAQHAGAALAVPGGTDVARHACAPDAIPIEWRTFHGWCRAHWPADQPYRSPISAQRRAVILAQIWQEHLANTALSAHWLADEIDWIKDRLITTRAAYLEADRSGRGVALGPAQRARVFDAVLAYSGAMRAQGRFDYGDVPRGLWQALQDGSATPPQYDFVLVDEAQFFAPIWFEILKQVLRPETGQLFLVADPTQGFLKRRQSWLASGLHVRGRTQRLGRSYRTTRAILAFATRFYQLRLPEDEAAPQVAVDATLPAGVAPAIVALTSEQDETTRVVQEIQALAARGVPLRDILVLHAAWQGAEVIRDRLQQTFGQAAVTQPRTTPPGDALRVCTLNAATGLESPIVFVLGAHRLLEAEGGLDLGDDERAELRRDNTRRLYMACTRAGQRLTLTYVGPLPPIFAQLQGSAGSVAL